MAIFPAKSSLLVLLLLLLLRKSQGVSLLDTTACSEIHQPPCDTEPQSTTLAHAKPSQKYRHQAITLPPSPNRNLKIYTVPLAESTKRVPPAFLLSRGQTSMRVFSCRHGFTAISFSRGSVCFSACRVVVCVFLENAAQINWN